VGIRCAENKEGGAVQPGYQKAFMWEAEAVTIRGFLERLDAASARGWCCDREGFDKHLPVEVWLDGRLLVSGVANIGRSDLAKAGLGDGDHGFVLFFPNSISSDSLSRVEVHVPILGSKSIVLPRLIQVPANLPTEQADLPLASMTERRLPRCVLHIGMEKTGSTSIQRFLAINRASLLSKGILVPRALAPKTSNVLMNHIALATTSMDIARDNEPLRTELIGVGRQLVLAHRDAIRRELAAEIAADGGNCTLMLLSSEHCQSRLSTTEEIQRLQTFLHSFCEKVEVVIYLRPQHEAAVSSYATMLKNGVIEANIFPVAANTVQDRAIAFHYDYDALVTRWAAVFGATSLEVRLFGSNVIDDLMQHLQIDTTEFEQLSSNQNVGLDTVGSRALRELNAALAGSALAGDARVRGLILQALDATHQGGGVLPSRQDAMNFQSRFDDSNESLRKRCFPDLDRLFHIDFSRYGEEAMAKRPTLEEFATTMIDILSYLAKWVR